MRNWLHRTPDRLPTAEDKTKSATQVLPRHSLKNRITVATLVIFLAGFWSLSLLAGKILRTDMERLLGQQQFSTASIIAANIEDQLERRANALEQVAALAAQAMPDKPAKVQELIDRLPILQTLFNGGIVATGIDGHMIADFPHSANWPAINFLEIASVASTLSDGKTTIAPIQHKNLDIPAFSITVAIRDSRGEVSGALVGITNLGAHNFLGHITKARYGETGGYLLVAPQQRLVLTATDQRRLMEALPAPGLNPMIDRFIEGNEGSSIIVGPHGVQVLASDKKVPIAGWILSAVLPTEEAFAPMRDMQQRMLLLTLALTLLVAGLTWWMLRRQFSPMLAATTRLEVMSANTQALTPLPVARQDEIGQLIGGFNRLLGTLAQREEALKESEQRWKFAIEGAGDGLWDWNLNDGSVFFSKRWKEMLGFTEDEITPCLADMEKHIHPDDRADALAAMQTCLDGNTPIYASEHRVRCKDGSYKWILDRGMVVSRAPDGKALRMIGTHSDISTRKAAQDEIRSLAFYDPLTALPNRRLLLDRLRQALAASTRSGHQGALMFIDLDNFKTINDTLGHDKGDLLLQQVAERLLANVREGDTVARLGGDEFVAMLENLSENVQEAATQAENAGEKILAALNQPYLFAGHPKYSSASIGITLFADHQESINELMKRADLSMYQAKNTGGNTLRFFNPEMQALVMARAALEASLREALLKTQFLLYYQAQVTDAHRLTGAEALVRWQHPQRGVVPPDEFIPLAEKTGLILPLGQWVLEAACAQLASWATRPGLAHLTVAVNISALQFHHRDFVNQVLTALEHTGANPKRLKLELTESLLIDNVEDVIARMESLKQKGVGFSLDEFGTGYSSLSYLKRLPLDQLKIDRGFIRDILTDANDAAIAKMVVALGESLGLSVIAEGVEIEAQRNFLADRGCHAYQGYLFSQPLPAEAFERLATTL